jgi:phosphoglycolate phosphatase-like HAD superfamily hydrolase
LPADRSVEDGPGNAAAQDCRAGIASRPTHFWDWNGTLFADAAALMDATIEAFRGCGMPVITRADYQRHHTQPISAFYERLAGLALTTDQQRRLDESFIATYERRRSSLSLTADARSASLTGQPPAGANPCWSMHPQHKLDRLIDAHGIRSCFARVDGTNGSNLDRKSSHLARHIEALRLEPAEVTVIGDSVDDVDAARQCGTRGVIYHPGEDSLHSRAHFAELAVPIVATLEEAVRIAESW